MCHSHRAAGRDDIWIQRKHSLAEIGQTENDRFLLLVVILWYLDPEPRVPRIPPQPSDKP